VISIQRLHKFFGEKDLFTDCELFIGPTDRIGLVGENGTGKTTLLKMLLGMETPNSGKIMKPKDLRIGYLPQEVVQLSGTSVLDHVMDVAQEFKWIEDEMTRISRGLERAEGGDALLGLAKRQGHLLERFSHLGGYQLESRAKKILSGLGFDEAGFNLPIESLSGGWIMRASLARILLSAPDLILLDEPTNHLDLESLLWLEDYLTGVTSALLIISHDRVFLNRVVDRILEIHGCKLISYAGSYDFYRGEKAKREEIRWAAYRKQRERIAQIQRFIEKNRVRKDRAKQVQSRIKMLEKMERIDPPQRSKSINFEFPAPPRTTKTVIELQGVSKSYGSHLVYRDLSGPQWCWQDDPYAHFGWGFGFRGWPTPDESQRSHRGIFSATDGKTVPPKYGSGGAIVSGRQPIPWETQGRIGGLSISGRGYHEKGLRSKRWRKKSFVALQNAPSTSQPPPVR
jgi:ATP-binding cassette subfamily F protein 3